MSNPQKPDDFLAALKEWGKTSAQLANHPSAEPDGLLKDFVTPEILHTKPDEKPTDAGTTNEGMSQSRSPNDGPTHVGNRYDIFDELPPIMRAELPNTKSRQAASPIPEEKPSGLMDDFVTRQIREERPTFKPRIRDRGHER